MSTIRFSAREKSRPASRAPKKPNFFLVGAPKSGTTAMVQYLGGPHPLTVAMSYLALTALVHRSPRSRWLKAAVAGLAVGIGVGEGADLGAIFSVFVGAFAFYRGLLAAGHGVHGLSSLYLRRTEARGSIHSLGGWWKSASLFERRWFVGCALAVGFSLIAAVKYASSASGLETYLQEVGFNEAVARQIAVFSFREVNWYLLFLSLGVGLVLAISTGQFSGRASQLGATLLGLLLVVDLGHADQPWIIYWDYAQKYASNPIIDVLRQAPYEHRVASLPGWLPYQFALPEPLLIQQSHWDDVYETEWLQQLFPYYDIQSLDLVQMRTMPQDLERFEDVLQFRGARNMLPLLTRRWQLTNTRYLLGCAGLLPLLNQALDPVHHRFKLVSHFDFVPKPGVLSPSKLDEITSRSNRRYTVTDFLFSCANS